MTRDKYRETCIKAMEKAMRGPLSKRQARINAVAALDSLHGIAFVDPVEPAEDMILEADERAILDGSAVRLYLAMAAAGNLTNTPEEKP